MIRVKKIETEQELKEAFAIRTKVFVEEQDCPPEEEFDGLDNDAIHFIAFINDIPVGTNRYRKTDKGYKLERFAVLKEQRGSGVGKRLVQTTLGHLEKQQLPEGTLIYLHAQLAAMPLYSRYGFEKIGDKFVEAGIEHFRMEKRV